METLTWFRQSVLVFSFLAALTLETFAQAPLSVLLPPTISNDSAGSSMIIRADVPPNSTVQLQFRTNVAGGTWSDYSVPTLTLNNNATFSAPLPSGVLQRGDSAAPASFFRLQVNSYPVTLSDNGRALTLSLVSPTPAGIVFNEVAPGVNAYGADPFTLIPAGSVSGANAEDLLSKLGLRPWVTPPPRDDPNAAARQLGSSSGQTGLHVAQADTGTGTIAQGFVGFPNSPAPSGSGGGDPQASPNSEKALNRNIQPAAPGIFQARNPNVTEPGRHLRLNVLVSLTGGIQLKTARSVPGDALLNSFPRSPDVDSLILVFRSPQAPNSPGNIYFISNLPNPFLARSYGPPTRGSHGAFQLTEAQVRFPVPVLPRDLDLTGLQVQIYQVSSPLVNVTLTPAEFIRNANSFRLLGELSGPVINRLALQSGGAAAATSSIHALSPTAPATLKTILSSGPKAKKYNMVIIGDGFKNTTADQGVFDAYVTNTFMKDFFGRDVQPEILNAINVYQINTFSVDSGVTQVDGTGAVTSNKDTALRYRYSGIWSRCWMEGATNAPSSQDLIDGVVDSLLPEADVVALVLNEPGFGGCSGGVFVVTRGVNWDVIAHEFGHFFGKLGDEYQCNAGDAGCTIYLAGEPGTIDLTKIAARYLIKWNEWIPPTRPIPTVAANVSDVVQDVGLFPGATMGNQQWWFGLYRPSMEGRMRGNVPEHNPVGYTNIRTQARPRQEGDFRKNVTGDFDGDGKTDTVLLDDRQLSLYLARDRDVGPNDPVTGKPPRAVTGVLQPTWFHTDILYNAAKTISWEFRSNDQLYVGDFDGDGKADIIIVNLTDWAYPYLGVLKSFGDHFEPILRYDRELPSWDAMQAHDEFYIGDFNGDGKADIMVYNGLDWSMPYFIMLRASGTSLTPVRRYDRYLPVWEMGRNEKFFVGDFNGDKKADIISLNRTDWSQVHLMAFNSTGTQLALASRAYGTIDGTFWTMRRQDQLYVLDYNGDGHSDFALFNGLDWSTEYLGIFNFGTRGFTGVKRYDDVIPGWDMSRRDRFYVADVDGDGRQDLVVYNSENWDTAYLGMLKSDGAGGLAGSWQKQNVGAWSLGSVDDFRVADFRGDAGWVDLFVYNKDWFGLLRSMKNKYVLEAIYPQWIHNQRYHSEGWW